MNKSYASIAIMNTQIMFALNMQYKHFERYLSFGLSAMRYVCVNNVYKDVKNEVSAD